MGNVQISQELFMQLIRFHSVEDESCEKEIKDELSYSFGIQRTENVGTARSEDCHPKYVL